MALPANMVFFESVTYKIRALIRLLILVGIHQVRMTWNGKTIIESSQGKATPLEAAAYLTLQNIPRLKNRKNIDHKLRKHIKRGDIRRGVLANGYPEFSPLQPSLFDSEPQQELLDESSAAEDLVTLVEEINEAETELLTQYSEYDDDDDDEYEYGHAPLFLYGFLSAALIAGLIPLWMWLSPSISEFTLKSEDKYSPQVIKVAAARGQDCARSVDLYSQLYCGELWRKELSSRVERNYIDLLAVSSAIDNLHKQSGFEVDQPLAQRIEHTQNTWATHLEALCNTAAAVENLGAQRSNKYLDCINTHLIAREQETREQLNHLRSLGWQEQADDVLNNELIAIRNMAASKLPADITSENSTENDADNEAGINTESDTEGLIPEPPPVTEASTTEAE